jgi:hypothetical protein
VLTVVQIALGAWVSSNYAVLACTDFPTCQGSWWPEMDVGEGFVVRRPLGAGSEGNLPFAALTAIHMAHRLGAIVLIAAIVAFAWRLIAAGGPARPWALALLGCSPWQVASGLGNVLLGWPLAAAVAHTAGRRRSSSSLSVLLARSAPARAARAQVDTGGRPRSLHRIDSIMSEALAPVAPRSVSLTAKLRQYYALTKPRVVQLIVFCALIGMLLATPGLPDWRLALAGSRESGSLPPRRRRSTAWSSSASTPAWRAPRGAPRPPAS